MPCFHCGVSLKPSLGSLSQEYTMIILMGVPEGVNDVFMGHIIVQAQE